MNRTLEGRRERMEKRDAGEDCRLRVVADASDQERLIADGRAIPGDIFIITGGPRADAIDGG